MAMVMGNRRRRGVTRAQGRSAVRLGAIAIVAVTAVAIKALTFASGWTPGSLLVQRSRVSISAWQDELREEHEQRNVQRQQRERMDGDWNDGRDDEDLEAEGEADFRVRAPKVRMDERRPVGEQEEDDFDNSPGPGEMTMPPSGTRYESRSEGRTTGFDDPVEGRFERFSGGQSDRRSGRGGVARAGGEGEQDMSFDFAPDGRESNQASASEEPPAKPPKEMDMTEYLGVVKSFSSTEGYGFVECAAAKSKYGGDVFLHRKEYPDNEEPRKGQHVNFNIEILKGKAQARHVKQIRLGASVSPTKQFVGRVKSFAKDFGYGFIECDEAFAIFNADVFLHKVQAAEADITSMGDLVLFTVEVRKGKAQARNVQKTSSSVVAKMSGGAELGETQLEAAPASA